MPTLQEQLQAAVVQTTTDSGLLHTIVHGDANTTVTTEGGPVKSIAKVIGENQTELAQSIVDVTTKRDETLVAASAAATARLNAENSATEALDYRDAAQTAATNAAASNTSAAAHRTAAEASELAAAQSQSAALTAKSVAETAATNAATSAANALTSENAANAAAARLTATSTSSVSIGTGSKTFTTQSGKMFAVGTWILAVSTASAANYVHGQVTSYSGTTLVVNVTNTGGSGSPTSWNISVSGTRGATGASAAASTVTYTNTTSGLVATNVQAAVDELDTRIDNLNTGNLSVSGALTLSGIISPAQLTTDTHDWNPAGLVSASAIRVSTDAARTITGIAGGSGGRVLVLENVGGNDITLKHEATSVVANRFIGPGNGDFTLKAASSAMLRYDAASSRWRIVANPQSAGSYNHGKVTNLFVKNTSTGSLFIDITAGEAILCSTTGVCVRHTNISLLNKQVFGSNKQDGSIGGNAWAYLWLVSNGTTVQEWFTQSPFSIPSVAATTYPFYKLISAFIVLSVGNNINFRQRDNRVDLLEGAINIGSGITGNVNAPGWIAVQVLSSDTLSAASGYRAPKDITRTVFGHVCCLSSSTTGQAIASPTSTTFGAWNSSNHPPAVAFCANGHGGMASYFEFVPHGNNIFWASSTAAGYITLDGYTLDI